MSAEAGAGILIVGTGAMAGLFAARLAAAGAGVTVLGSWPEGLQTLRQEGVRLVEAGSSEKRYPVRVVERPEDCYGLPAALVLVKSWQTRRAAAQLAACLPADGLALTLQNGLGNCEILAEALGAQRVALGVATQGATLLAPGRVRAVGASRLALADHPRLSPLAAQLAAAGFEIEILSDAKALLWGKLVINAAINPLTALLGVPNGALLERPSARRLMQALACEAAAAAAAQNIDLPYPDPVQAAEEVAWRTAANYSSMLQDVRRAAPTEIDAICGAIVACGQAYGVLTPVNDTLLHLIKALRANPEI
jgi:2-dehydropantoate 2-reductase